MLMMNLRALKMIYRCKQNDVLDEICHDYYGDEKGTTEKVLQANPGLADKGVHLPIGLEIELPDLSENTVNKLPTTRLW